MVTSLSHHSAPEASLNTTDHLVGVHLVMTDS
jgi:hypothetical protein